MSTPGSRPPVLFLHGYWHGSWCWAEVLARVTAAGHGARPRRLGIGAPYLCGLHPRT